MTGMSSSKSELERQQRVLAGGPVVAEDGLALPQPPVEADGVLHLGHRDPRDPHDVGERTDAATDAEGEAARG